MRPLAVLTVILAVAVVILSARLLSEWSRFEATHSLGDPSQLEGPTSGEPVAGQTEVIQDWGAIALFNPFSADRSDATVQVAPTIVTGPRPFLYGTIRLEDEHLAMMSAGSETDPARYRPVRLGESIDGWQLVEIEEKFVVVGNGDLRQTITMNDPSARLPRVQARPAPAQGAQVSTVGTAPPPVPAPASQAPGARGGPFPANQPGAAAPGTTRTIRTPFGTTTIQVPPQ